MSATATGRFAPLAATGSIAEANERREATDAPALGAMTSEEAAQFRAAALEAQATAATATSPSARRSATVLCGRDAVAAVARLADASGVARTCLDLAATAAPADAATMAAAVHGTAIDDTIAAALDAVHDVLTEVVRATAAFAEERDDAGAWSCWSLMRAFRGATAPGLWIGQGYWDDHPSGVVDWSEALAPRAEGVWPDGTTDAARAFEAAILDRVGTSPKDDRPAIHETLAEITAAWPALSWVPVDAQLELQAQLWAQRCGQPGWPEAGQRAPELTVVSIRFDGAAHVWNHAQGRLA